MSRPSVAVIVLDTLRYDIFNRYFEWIPGVSFENAYSTSHWTVPAHASLLTGKYPSEVGVHGKSRTFDCPQRSIVEVLDESGYNTRLWTANMQIHEWGGWERGFEQVRGPTDLHPLADESVDWRAYHQESRLNGFLKYLTAAGHAFVSDNRTVPSLRYGLKFTRKEDDGARDIRQRAIETEFDSEEFLFVNLMEAHTPHYPPDGYRTIHEEINFKIGDAFAGDITEGDRNRKAYDDSAAYLSDVYRDIFNVLIDEFNYVITLSDHGDMLGEHEMWNHGYGIYPELAHVPMVISGDGIEGRSVGRTVSLLDVPQTIAEMTSVEFTDRGVDLLADSTGQNYLVEYHGLLPWHRDQLRRKGVESLYDELDRPLRGIALKSGDYVYQTDDGYVSTEGTVTDRKIGELNSLTEEVPERSVESDSGSVGSDVEERLKNLGYA